MHTLKKTDLSFILYFGTMTWAVFFATRFFGTNDDMLMMLLSSGMYTGTPTEYVVFENILLGQFFKHLYSYFPSVNWYVFILTTMQVLSFTAIYYLMRDRLEKKTFLFLFVLPILYFIVEFIVYLQFTKVAFTLAIVGIIFLLLYLNERRNIYLFYAFTFICFAYIVREHSVYATILLAIPLGGWMLIRNKDQILNFRFLGFLILLALSIVSLKMYDMNYYNSTASWKNYKELINIRGNIYYDRSITKKCFLEQGKIYNITQNDVTTYYKWTNDDTQVFTPELLRHIKTACSKGISNKFEKVKHKKFLKSFIDKLTSFDFIFIFIFMLYVLLILSRRYKILYSLYFIYFMAILFYLFTMTFENRVVASLTLEFYLFALLLIHILGIKKHYIYHNVTSFGLVGLFIVSAYVSIFSNVIHKKKAFHIKTELVTLKGHYVIVSKSKNFFTYLPLDTDFNKMFKDTVYYYIGWNLSSPDNDSILDNMSNFYELALQKENVIFYMDAHRLPVIKQYFLEHFKKEVTFHKIQDDYYKMKVI